MEINELIKKNRSYRRFDQNVTIPKSDLIEMVDLARLTPSATNVQPTKFVICNESSLNAKLFACTRWAGFIKDWGGPKEGERPTAYIALIRDLNVCAARLHDEGIIAQTIMLEAVNKGYGGCIIGSVDKDKVKELFHLSEQCEVALILALGKPIEVVVLEDIVGDDTHYYRDEQEVHHVPKRTLEEVLLSVVSAE